MLIQNTSMSKKKCVLRRRAAERRMQNAIDTYIKWCKDNVTVREKMEELLGGKVDIIQTFPASEGFFAFQDDYEKEGLLLQSNHGIFYEFSPLEQYGRFDSAQQPLFERLTLKDVELNKDYALILTTNSGLWT